MLKFIRYIFYLGISVFILLESSLRFFPVSDSYWTQPVNKENPIKRFKENTQFKRQMGFDFSRVIIKNTNNFGYFSDVDFYSKNITNKPTVVVIGDSFVEASQVSNSDSFHGLLSKKFPHINIYPIGTSGDALSQYLVYAKFAKEKFNPDKFIFTIIENDFDESWLRFKSAPSAHYFDDKGTLTRIDYKPSILGKIARNSVVFRYLFIDIHLPWRVNMLLQNVKKLTSKKKKDTATITDQDNKEINEELLSYSIKSIDIFLKELSNIVEDKPVLLVVDGDRRTIYKNILNGNDYNKRDYDSHVEKAKWKNQVYDYLVNKIILPKNINLIDMHPIFLKNWKENMKKFDFYNDYHWNEYAHSIVAEVISDTLIFNYNTK